MGARRRKRRLPQIAQLRLEIAALTRRLDATDAELDRMRKAFLEALVELRDASRHPSR